MPVKQVSVSDNGAILIRQLSAGSYELTATYDQRSKTVSFDASARDLSRLELRIDEFEAAPP